MGIRIMSSNWRGVFPAATTQYASDGSVDLKSTRHLVESMIDAGVHGLIMLGSVGENTVLEPAEKLAVIKMAKEAAKGRIPVLSGVAENSTPAACRYAKTCEEAGLDGLMVLPGMIYKADGREAVEHFRTVAKATSLPIMIYNNPPAYNVDLKPDDLKALADQKNLICIKESAGNSRRFTDIVNTVGNRYILFCGLDDLVLEAAALGAVGWVSGFTDAFPHESVKLWELLAAGKYAEALPIYRWFTPVLHLDDHPKLVQYIKLAQSMTGVGTESVRMPRLPLVGEERDRIKGIIQKAIDTRPRV
jgi:dihydrodipicolinate synthase/N-acetylneuraminate lyase